MKRATTCRSYQTGFYVIPPNRDLSLLHGWLYLLEPSAPRGLRLPVDFFLRSLADDRGDKAIGVILSGMGSDGVLGLRAIKEKSGLTLAQTPDTAKAASMPSSAIAAGLADIVAPPSQMPQRIATYVSHDAYGRSGGAAPPPSAQSALDKVMILLRDRCGSDFSLYKSNTLYRRIERRCALHQKKGIAEYVSYLRDNPQELDLLFKELLIGVTNFFRDPPVWEQLRTHVIPALLARYPAGKAMRAWTAACSSGEEAYSLAIVFREALEAARPDGRFSLQIYATDLDADAINRARRGVYPKNIAADVSPARLARYFVADDGGFRIAKEIRDMVIFAPQNLIADPPFTRLDLLTCRNLLIYLRPELQNRVLQLFHYALNPDGVLLLGNAETVGTTSRLFAPQHGSARIFDRLDKSRPLAEMAFPAGAPTDIRRPDEATTVPPSHNLEHQVDQLIQQTYAPAAVLVSADGDIIYISGRTGKYLEPAAGRVNINIHAMARDGLREALPGVIHKALRQTEPILLNDIQIGSGATRQAVDIIVQGLNAPELLRGRVLIVFKDVARAPGSRATRKTAASGSQDALMAELALARETLRITHEDMQASVEAHRSANEELQSTNEELQSTNEELQSTNEELTTSKEEMQSLNEELQTVNAELQAKVDDLTWERNDMTNLLNATELATIFLDSHMKLRRFTTHATHIFKLIPSDIGRPLSDVSCDLDDADILADAAEVLRSLKYSEREIATHDGRWYRVRIMPYRTQTNMIDGVVITLMDITAIKSLEAKLRTRHGSPSTTAGDA